MKKILRLLLLILNIGATCAMIISAYGGHIDPTVTSIPGIALMIFPLILASDILLLLLNLITWRRLAFMPAFTILACAPAIWNFCPLNIGHNTAPQDYNTIRVLTYNTYHFRDFNSTTDSDTGLNSTLSTILDIDADIVCIQEGSEIYHPVMEKYASQIDSIYSRYPYRLAHNTLIWSKYPLENIPMPATGDPTASFQCANVTIGSSTLTLYNIHLQSLGLSNADKRLYGTLTTSPTTVKLDEARYDLISKLSAAMKKRSRQAHQLRDIIDNNNSDNIIVAGDFNDIEDCYAQRVIQGNNLESTFTAVGVGPTVTYYADRFYFNIDHMLYGGKLIPLDYQCVKVRISDHYPVIGTYAIPR